MNADRIVVDASVAVKWFVSETLTREAVLIAESLADLVAPPLIIAEVSSALRKKLRAGDITYDNAREAIGRVFGEFRFVSDEGYAGLAFDIAVRYDRSVYDAQYVALALQEGCQLVTADEKLYYALSSVYPEALLWLGDVRA